MSTDPLKIWKNIIEEMQTEEKQNQRLPGEISVDEFLEMSGLKTPRDTMFKQMCKMVQKGQLTRRKIRIDGKAIVLFKPVE